MRTKSLPARYKSVQKHKMTSDDIMLHAMAFPATLSLILFSYIPMLGLIMAFQNLDFQKGIFGSPFVGFDNFRFLFATKDAWRITRNTVCYNIAFIIVNLVLALLLALLLNEMTNKFLAKTVQTVLIMPHFLSATVIAIIVFAFLSPTWGDMLVRIHIKIQCGKCINCTFSVK